MLVELNPVMAYYDYVCHDCQHVTEVKASFKEHAAGLTVKCSHCDSSNTQQIFNKVAAVHTGSSSSGAADFCPEMVSGGCAGGGCCFPN